MNFSVEQIFPFGALITPGSARQPLLDVDVTELRCLLHRNHLLVLRGFSALTTAEEFVGYCALWGEISVWPFGKVLELVEQRDAADHIFDHKYVPLHWDGMYRPQVPELQMFQCVSAPNAEQGGRTTFSNTSMALERAAVETREIWGAVTGTYHREMEFYKSKTEAPLIVKHPTRDIQVIRYCEPPPEEDDAFINRPLLQFHGVPQNNLAQLHCGLRRALYAPENFYAHAWQADDLVISDNYTLLHGRESYTSGALRHLRRVHVLGQPPLENPHLVTYS